jgi:hypothetical protein
MCTFTSSAEAADAAVDMQRSLKQAIARDEIDIKSLMIRIGVHGGPVVAQEADVFGDAVNVAARVVAHAKPGQILMTKQAIGKLPQAARESVRFVGSTQVKGKDAPLELYEAIWEHENLTQLQNVIETKPGLVRLVAQLGEQTLELGPELALLRMGRGSENEFVIADSLASRQHARIEYRRNRFVLIDQSLNGTYLARRGAAEVVLRRDEVALEGSGLIALGKPTEAAGEHCVRYAVRAARQPAQAAARKPAPRRKAQ